MGLVYQCVEAVVIDSSNLPQLICSVFIILLILYLKLILIPDTEFQKRPVRSMMGVWVVSLSCQPHLSLAVFIHCFCKTDRENIFLSFVQQITKAIIPNLFTIVEPLKKYKLPVEPFSVAEYFDF